MYTIHEKEKEDLNLELILKYRDLVNNGTSSKYWVDILPIIKEFQKLEKYEYCQVLWYYYTRSITG
jgi:hypothetical protein